MRGGCQQRPVDIVLDVCGAAGGCAHIPPPKVGRPARMGATVELPTPLPTGLPTGYPHDFSLAESLILLCGSAL